MTAIKRFRSLVITAGALALMSTGAQGAVVTVNNSSFEDPATILTFTGGVEGDFSVDSMAQWTTFTQVGNFMPNLGALATDPWTALPGGNGVRTAWSNGGSFEQITGATITSGLTYNLWVDVGDRKDSGAADPFGGGRIELFAATSGNVLATTELGAGPGNGNWTTVHASFVADAIGIGDLGDLLGIRLDGDGIQTNFDDVQLSAVPLPPALWLFLSSLVGLAAVVRRRRKKKIALSPEFATAT